MNANSNNSQTPGNRRTTAGVILIGIGSVILLKEMGLFYLPSWIVSWPMLLIVIGLLSGIRHNFRNPGSFILIAIGTLFLINDFVWSFSFVSIWPIVLIAIGVRMLFSRNSTWCRERWEHRHTWKRHMAEQTNL